VRRFPIGTRDTAEHLFVLTNLFWLRRFDLLVAAVTIKLF
jgi:hypothetical protein